MLSSNEDRKEYFQSQLIVHQLLLEECSNPEDVSFLKKWVDTLTHLHQITMDNADAED